MTSAKTKTDIIISIHPPHVANIASRAKDHEFRKYLIPPPVARLWIYETRPTSAITYVATISAGKKPGEIVNERGLRNAEFNRGDPGLDATYAYEITRLQRLETPITLDDMKARKWLNGAPQKYCYVNEAMAKAVRGFKMVEVFGVSSQPPALSKEEEKVETVTVKITDSKGQGAFSHRGSNYTLIFDVEPPAGIQKRGHKRQRIGAR
jgi:predicted transcriptional regulator